MKTALRLAAVGAVAATALSGCGAGDGAADDSVIRIATINPVTGPAATFGKPVLASIEQAVDEVNAAGGLEVGGKTYTLELKNFDDKGTPEGAQAVARQAMDDDYEFVVGPFSSGSAVAVTGLMAQSESLWVLPTASVDGPQKNERVFRTAPSISTYTEPIFEWLEGEPDLKSVAIITDETNPALVAEHDRLVDGIEELGADVALEQNYQLGDTDFRAPASQAIDKNVDLYIVRGNVAEMSQVLQQVRELGGTMRVLWGAPGATNKDTEGLVDDVKVLENLSQSGPLITLDAFVTAGDERALRVAEELGDDTGSFSTAVHDGMQIFLAGLENAEEPTADAVKASLEALLVDDLAGRTLQDIEGSDGKVFNDHSVTVRGAVVDWVQGKGWTLSE